MSQSKLTISSIEYPLYVTAYDESVGTILNEKQTIVDPDHLTSPNSVLIASGNKKHQFTISGYCTISERSTFMGAMRSNTKVYPRIYPGGGNTDALDSSAYYYFTAISGKFDYVNQYYWFSMTFIHGGVDPV